MINRLLMVTFFIITMTAMEKPLKMENPFSQESSIDHQNSIRYRIKQIRNRNNLTYQDEKNLWCIVDQQVEEEIPHTFLETAGDVCCRPKDQAECCLGLISIITPSTVFVGANFLNKLIVCHGKQDQEYAACHTEAGLLAGAAMICCPLALGAGIYAGCYADKQKKEREKLKHKLLYGKIE